MTKVQSSGERILFSKYNWIISITICEKIPVPHSTQNQFQMIVVLWVKGTAILKHNMEEF